MALSGTAASGEYIRPGVGRNVLSKEHDSVAPSVARIVWLKSRTAGKQRVGIMRCNPLGYAAGLHPAR